MTIFKTWAFPVTGGTANRTLPDRLADIHNVRDFGAVGDGVTDDHTAIMAALNWRSGNTTRGTVYFPPGTYYVSAPIDFSAPSDVDSGPFVHFLGEMGLSTVVGDFDEYVFKRELVSTPRWSGGHYIEKLTIINRYAGGGGIRLGVAQGGFIRDCDITADIALNDDNTDEFIDSGNLNGSFETVIENCNCRPYNTLATGSYGLIKMSDGPVTNCTFIGFDVGMGSGSGQGGATVDGCYFEGNNLGLSLSTNIEGRGGGGNACVSGCYFKNNGVGIDRSNGNGSFRGIKIEAASGTIPGNPQYGIRMAAGRLTTTTFQGVSVTGEYAQAGIKIEGGESTRNLNTIFGVGSVNSGAGDDWELPDTAMTATFKSCNIAPVFTVLQLPAVTANISSTSWSGGTATVNFTSPGPYYGNLIGKTARLTVAGVTPSGYNGTFTGVFTDATQITYTLSNPGGSGGAAGTVFFTGVGLADNVYEGETYNVSDANTSTWGAAVTAGGGATRAKIRYTTAAWTVVGK